MIYIQNGEIVVENLSYPLNSNIQRKNFEETFPKEFIRNIDDMHNGYIRFNIWGGIISKDHMNLLSLCFKPNNEIESISIYPHVSQNIKLDWSDWSEEKFAKEKMICDKWLINNFNLKENNEFSWGTISSYSDTRSGSNGIIVRYN
jgi:hypothetical protein